MAASSLKLILASGTAFAALAGALPAVAQVSTEGTTQPATTPTTAETPTSDADQGADGGAQILVTGSRIKQDPNNSALPLQIITNQELTREGISSPEQLISFLSSNGTGNDNLSSNSDVVGADSRGKNGLSAANLRGQGSSATLVLLNGRRVSSHGQGGSAVDVNQIPFAAIDRIEVLKDGASAIYGTDAIGGVINFITKTNFQGLTLNGFTDITEQGDSPIYRLSATAGYGDLAEDGFNVMGAVSKSWNGILFGRDRDFVNGNQPNRGLSIDTRGTPIATAQQLNPTGAGIGIAQTGTLLGGTTGATNLAVLPGTTTPNPAFFIPGTTQAANGGVNPLRLPGGAGCASVDGGMNYDSVLWAVPGAALACSWDTARAATLQQPLETLTYYARGTVRLGGAHEVFVEVTGSDATARKAFSNNQYTGNGTSLPIAYPLNALTAPTYNQVYDRIAAVLPAVGAVGDRTVDAVGNYGKPIAYRYRCLDCGERSLVTDTRTFRVALGVDGPLFDGWDYQAGASYARSKSDSTLGSGYHYTGVYTNSTQTANATVAGQPVPVIGQADPRAPTGAGATAPGIVGLFNSGILNPFSLAQTPAALAALQSVSADGVTLYGGQYEVKQFDASISGSLFGLPAGDVKMAVGVDYRRESYKFDAGSPGALVSPSIFNAPFDNAFALPEVNRDVKAAYAEVLIPILSSLEVTVAGRVDDYSGFGSTVNPKVTAKFRPADWLMFRASYNTGFRVPTFNQIFNGQVRLVNPGNTLVDPTTCPQGTTAGPQPGCAAITPDSISGGNLTLGPETSKQYSVGVVFQPARRFSLSVDYWNIGVDNTISAITIPQLFANISSFGDRIQRTNGIITLVDLRTGNFGSRRTKGLEFVARGGFEALGGVIGFGLDGTYLLDKREKLLPNLPYTNLVGKFTLLGDLGLEWKHNAFVTYTNGDFGLSFSQIYRSGYANQTLPASAARPDFNPRVKPYMIYNATISQRIDNRLSLTAGVRNIFDTDPPFAITYDSNSGSGGSWEPRVADPRGRSFTVSAEVKF
ncbi:TonB-dependent receptor domain-containing protein [Sphingomonas sp.]|jgi:iron complex outermembrane receptor protein|uniref:TonB-dependent receptor domain-containing protein n=1 Tax=Sphingomonas sp. TaxID=28214 RepID=UPI002EDA07AB